MRAKKSVALLIFVILSGCASVKEFVESNIQKPQVEFTGARFSGLSLEAVDLLFDLKMTNPNPVGMTLAGFDYDFLINDNHFLQGNQENQVRIPANGDNTIQIPVTLRFADLYKTFTGLVKGDSAKYGIKCGVSFDLPVLGRQRIPVSKEGSLPLLKLPKISLASLKLDKLNLTGADLKLNLKLKNPNAVDFVLKAISYTFEVNNRPWLAGSGNRAQNISAKGENILEFPISLNFLQMGQSVLQLLKSDQPLSYSLKGQADLASSLQLLGDVNLPFEQAGRIKLTK